MFPRGRADQPLRSFSKADRADSEKKEGLKKGSVGRGRGFSKKKGGRQEHRTAGELGFHLKAVEGGKHGKETKRKEKRRGNK